MANNPLEKYKEWALKSGFPFENDVLLAINQCMPASKITRNMEFSAKNEEGKPSIRSIDFLVSISKDLKNIPHRNWSRSSEEKIEVIFLIDCKYTAEESYLFTPSTNQVPITERSWPHLVPTLTKNEWGDHCSICRPDLLALAKLDTAYSVAGSGRKVKEQSRERDSVASALLQVLQGAEYFIKNSASLLGVTSKVDSSYNRNAYLYIPIIVTNAPLLMVRGQTTIEKIISSTTKEDIFHEENALLVEMPDIFDVKNSWDILKSVLAQSGNANLGWNEKGLEDGVVLFCNVDGMQAFFKKLSESFNSLKVDIQSA